MIFAPLSPESSAMTVRETREAMSMHCNRNIVVTEPRNTLKFRIMSMTDVDAASQENDTINLQRGIRRIIDQAEGNQQTEAKTEEDEEQV